MHLNPEIIHWNRDSESERLPLGQTISRSPLMSETIVTAEIEDQASGVYDAGVGNLTAGPKHTEEENKKEKESKKEKKNKEKITKITTLLGYIFYSLLLELGSFPKRHLFLDPKLWPSIL